MHSEQRRAGASPLCFSSFSDGVRTFANGHSREFEKADKKKARERMPKAWGATGVSKGCFTPTNTMYAESPGPSYIRPSKAKPAGFKAFKQPGPPATVRALL